MENKIDFWDDLNDIEDLNGSIEKEDYIYDLIKKFPEAEHFFRIACGDTVFGLGEKSFWNAFNKEPDRAHEHVSDWLGTLYCDAHIKYEWKNYNDFADKMLISSGDAQLEEIRFFFDNLLSYEKKWFCRALLHDLRCGVKRKTINRVFKRLGLKEIEKFSLQLADKIKSGIYDKEAVMKKIRFPCSGETKYDGIRVQAEIFQDEQGHDHCILTSRRGKPKTDDYPEIVKELLRLFGGQDLILDGEVISSTFQELTRKDSVVNKQYVVFDLLNDEKLDYKYRWSNLQSMILGIGSEIIVLPNHFDINNYEQLIEAFEIAVEREEEGIMVKFDDAPYERDSRKHMFKFKKVYTADLKIVGFNYGEGKRANKVGSLCLQTRDGDVSVDVGSGFTDEICEELTQQVIKGSLGSRDQNNNLVAPEFIGKICEISYNEGSIDKLGNKSIRFPRCVCIRDDKEIADDSNSIFFR